MRLRKARNTVKAVRRKLADPGLAPGRAHWLRRLSDEAETLLAVAAIGVELPSEHHNGRQ